MPTSKPCHAHTQTLIVLCNFVVNILIVNMISTFWERVNLMNGSLSVRMHRMKLALQEQRSAF